MAVPGYPVYYAPDIGGNYFFYDGRYWVYQDDNWYSSSWYNGPWDVGWSDVRADLCSAGSRALLPAPTTVFQRLAVRTGHRAGTITGAATGPSVARTGTGRGTR